MPPAETPTEGNSNTVLQDVAPGPCAVDTSTVAGVLVFDHPSPPTAIVVQPGVVGEAGRRAAFVCKSAAVRYNWDEPPSKEKR